MFPNTHEYHLGHCTYHHLATKSASSCDNVSWRWWWWLCSPSSSVVVVPWHRTYDSHERRCRLLPRRRCGRRFCLPQREMSILTDSLLIPVFGWERMMMKKKRKNEKRKRQKGRMSRWISRNGPNGRKTSQDEKEEKWMNEGVSDGWLMRVFRERRIFHIEDMEEETHRKEERDDRRLGSVISSPSSSVSLPRRLLVLAEQERTIKHQIARHFFPSSLSCDCTFSTWKDKSPTHLSTLQYILFSRPPCHKEAHPWLVYRVCVSMKFHTRSCSLHTPTFPSDQRTALSRVF